MLENLSTVVHKHMPCDVKYLQAFYAPVDGLMTRGLLAPLSEPTLAPSFGDRRAKKGKFNLISHR